MPKRATEVTLCEEEQTALIRLTKRHGSAQQLVLRARIVLAALKDKAMLKLRDNSQ